MKNCDTSQIDEVEKDPCLKEILFITFFGWDYEGICLSRLKLNLIFRGSEKGEAAYRSAIILPS